MTHIQSSEQPQEIVPAKGVDETTGMGSVPSISDAVAEAAKSEFEGQIPEGAIPAYVEYAKAVAGHLEDRLQDPVTLKSLLEVKMSALEFCINEGWAERLTKATLEASGVAEESMFSTMIDSALQMMPILVEQLKELAENVPDFLEARGITEQQVMESKEVGLSAANLKKYQEGTLTIGDLYVTQPLVIIKNTD